MNKRIKEMSAGRKATPLSKSCRKDLLQLKNTPQMTAIGSTFFPDRQEAKGKVELYPVLYLAFYSKRVPDALEFGTIKVSFMVFAYLPGCGNGFGIFIGNRTRQNGNMQQEKNRKSYTGFLLHPVS